MTDQPRIPTSTYRLQFNRTFTFNMRGRFSECYGSPYFQARAESLHGYDITAHNKLNAAIAVPAKM